jgi:N-acetylglucosamine-6-phosphate deacetylase
MATHLYNAMSGLGHRAPGLVGATLDQGRPYGLIADGVHVHPAALRIALAASPDAAVLVSDAMALTGSAQDRFTLARQPVYRRNGRLERADGTLAGADLTLVAAIENLARWTGRTVSDLAPMAHAAPLGILGDGPHPTPARFVVWHKGQATARIDGGGLLPLARV